jgi:putative PIN family toxin of toxin-antitoxin system
MVRAVVDTNVFISAALTPRGTPATLLAAAGDAFQLVWSAGIVAECLRVLTYDKVTKRLRVAGVEDASHALLARLSAGAELVLQDLIPVIRVVDGDPSDDLLIATALAGRASVLVTGDRRHMLSLREYAGVRILDPATFARELGLPGHPRRPGSVHEPVAPWGDGEAALLREAQRWAKARARRTAARVTG